MCIYTHVYRHIYKAKYIFIYIYSYIYITATLNVSWAIFSRCIIAKGFQQHNMRSLLIKAVKMRGVGQGYNTDIWSADSWLRSGTICSTLTYVNMQRQISANLHFNHSIFFHLQKLVSPCKILLTQLDANELFTSMMCCFSSTWSSFNCDNLCTQKNNDYSVTFITPLLLSLFYSETSLS